MPIGGVVNWVHTVHEKIYPRKQFKFSGNFLYSSFLSLKNLLCGSCIAVVVPALMDCERKGSAF